MDAFEPLKRLSNPDNLVDRITEAEKANLVQPTQIGNNLEEMAGNTGDLIVGNLISPAPEVEVMDVTSTDFTGSFMSGEGFTFDSEVYNVGGVNAGVLQFGLSQTDGKAYAGAGAVILGADGIQLLAANTSPLSFVDSGGNQLATILNTGSADPSLSTPSLQISTLQKTGKNSLINIEAIAASGQDVFLTLAATVDAVSAEIQLNKTEININSNGHDIDTKIQSDGNANAIFVDAGNNRVGIMNGAPTVALDVTGAVTASSSITSNAFFNMGATNAQTINAGVITVTGGRCIVDTQGGAATDDLDTINGGSDGDILVIYTANSARDVTAKDGTGNLALAGDFIMTNIRDRLVLLKDSGTWVEISRSDNQ